MERPEVARDMENRAEFGLTLLSQWQDLISAMEAELNLGRKIRDELEDLDI